VILESFSKIVLTQMLDLITTLDVTLSMDRSTVNSHDDRESNPHPHAAQLTCARTWREIAETMLVEEGMVAVTADEVARRTDVSLQVAYNRICGKSALLIAIAECSMRQNRA